VWGQGPIAVFGLSNSQGFAGVFSGRVEVEVLDEAGSTQLCRNFRGGIAACSSSLRYRTDVSPFSGGLDIVQRMRPIAFTWKQGGMRDVGLGSEDVEQVEPLLTFRNDKGEIEGVKYNQLSAVFVNAIRDQQAQIQQQQEENKRQRERLTAQETELAALKRLVCSSNPDADVCR